MRSCLLALLAPLLGPLAALADGCPSAPDHRAQLDALIAAAQSAPDETTGQGLSQQMWQLWDNAPDEPSQAMLDEGMRARASYDYLHALDRFNALVGYCPFYAEGYNQRAFIHFLRQDYAAALPDLDAALKINPRHIGALSGKALTLHALGQPGPALTALDAALALNPWLGERHLRPVLVQELDKI